jgi:hypothetical protein
MIKRGATILCCAVSLFFRLLIEPRAAGGTQGSEQSSAFLDIPPGDAIVLLDKKRFNLLKREDLQAFAEALGERPEHAGEEAAAGKTEKDEVKSRDPLAGKSARRGLKEIQRAAEAILDGAEPGEAGLKRILEIYQALQSRSKVPYTWRANVDLIGMFFRVRDLTLNAVGRGSRRNPAMNLATYRAADLSRIDPMPSSFWSRPASIAARDLYHGFDRAEIPSLADEISRYDGPHTGYGSHAGFYVLCKGQRWRIKFGEENSEPFGARILWALGFPARIADYAPELKVK